MVTLVSPNQDLNLRIEEFVKAADELVAKEYADRDFTFAPPPRHRADYLSDKWVRVVVLEGRVQDNGSVVWKESRVYAFICLKDSETKTLGKLKAGDIHKSASYKAPAKHARGSVFDVNFRTAMTPYGIVYMR